MLGAPCAVPLTQPQPWVWQRSRLWFAATGHPLLLRAVGGGGGGREVQVQCSLRRPALGYLQDHSVQGRALAPNSLLLELACAAGQLLWSQERTDNAVAATGVAFGPPLLLGGAGDALLSCSISPATGAVAVSSPAAPAAHMRAQLQSLEASPAAEPAAAGEATAAAAAAAAPAASWQDSCRLAAALLDTTSAPAGSSSAAFASLLTAQHQHTGYWCHPAVADASLHLAAALQQHALLMHIAAVGTYAPMLQLAGSVTFAAASRPSSSSSASSSHHVHNGASSNLAAVDCRWRPQTAVAAAADAVAGLTLPSSAMPTLAAHAGVSIAAIEEQLAGIVAGLLGGAVLTDQPLMEAGLDSIGEVLAVAALCACMPVRKAQPHVCLSLSPSTLLNNNPCAGSVELHNAVNSQFDIDLPATVSFDYPTIAALAGYIATRAAPAQQAPAPLGASLATRPAAQQGGVTDIVGWAASTAAPSDAEQCEAPVCSPAQSYALGSGCCGCTTCVPPPHPCDAAVAQSMYGGLDCGAPVPLERWDVERIDNAADAAVQVLR